MTPPWGWRPEELSKPLGQRLAYPMRELPYSEWRIQKTFDSARECEVDKEFWRKYPGYDDTICIASDDPRLKGN
jgi:hypothetical protein